MSMGGAIQALHAACAEQCFLKSLGRDATALEAIFIVEQLGRGWAAYADARVKKYARLEQVGFEFVAASRDEPIGIAEKRQGAIEMTVAWDWWHGRFPGSGERGV
jgi:hypothetical protein